MRQRSLQPAALSDVPVHDYEARQVVGSGRPCFQAKAILRWISPGSEHGLQCAENEWERTSASTERELN